MTTTESRPPHDGSAGQPGPVVRTTAGAVRGPEGGRGWPSSAASRSPNRRWARPGSPAPRPARPWDGIREAHAFGPPPPQDLGSLGRPGPARIPRGRRLADGQRLDARARPGRPPAGDGVDPRRRLQARPLRQPRLRRPAHRRRRRRRRRDPQLPPGHGGFRRTSRERPPTVGCSTRWPRWSGCGTTSPRSAAIPARSRSSGSPRAPAPSPRCSPCPRAAGLFRRAIAQSVPGTFFSDALARDIGTALAAEVGLRPTVADLGALAPARGSSAGETLAPKMLQPRRPLGPGRAHGHARSPRSSTARCCRRCPGGRWRPARRRDVDLIVGHNRDEIPPVHHHGGQARPITDERAAAALRLYAPRRRGGLPRGLPGRLRERALRTRPDGLAVRHALPPPGRGAAWRAAAAPTSTN